MLSELISLSFLVFRLSSVQYISDSSLTRTPHKHTARSVAKPFMIFCFFLSSSCNFSEVTVRQWRKMMARGNAGWFDIWLLGSDVVVNKTQAENYLQSTNQKAIIYSEDYSSMIFLN